MVKVEYFELGALAKPHGLKGAFHVFLDVDDPYVYEGLKSVFLQKGNEFVPYFIENFQIRDSVNLMILEGINTLDSAKELVGTKLFLPISFLPKLKDEQFYYHEIIDYQIHDFKLGDLGYVKEVYSTGAQDVIIMIYKSKEVLIPLIDQIVPKVNKKEKIVFTSLPEGLLEVYLEDDAN